MLTLWLHVLAEHMLRRFFSPRIVTALAGSRETGIGVPGRGLRFVGYIAECERFRLHFQVDACLDMP